MNHLLPLEILFHKFSDFLFIKNATFTLSFKEFSNQIKKTALFLKSKGLKKGDTVILSDIPDPETIILFFAVWLNKAMALPLNPKMPYYSTEEVIKLSQAKFMISAGEIAPNGITFVAATECFEDPIDTVDDLPLNWDLNIAATIILTSGSSGNPKLAVHTLANFLSNAYAVNTYFSIQQPVGWLLLLPLYHVAGLAIIFRCLISGSCIEIPDKKPFSLKDTNFSAQYVSMVAAQLWQFISDSRSIVTLRKFKVIFLGGSAIPGSLLTKLSEYKLNIYTSYGLTEMASTVAICNFKTGTTDHADILAGHSVSTAKQNEIVLKGPSLFVGYLNNGFIEKAHEKDGWFHTKDSGRIEKGKITVLGRLDNMFISGGENIFPEEIEKELLKLPGVRQAVVLPVAHPKYGQRPIAFVDSEDFTEDAIKIFLKKNLSSYKIPDKILHWPDSAESGLLKVNRAFLKTLV